ncbi:DUF1651 domain-containing protein [Synechococcus sp. CS-1330]|nr:DUF1651 domain-containing protein [Synechococcus sp. CS-1330]
MRFDLNPKSWSAYQMYFVDSGRPLPGAPTLKTRTSMRPYDARELSRKLKPRAGSKWHPSGALA